MNGLLACDAPLTPDEGEAHEWIVEELSHSEYANVPNPIARWIASLIDWFSDALSWKGQGTPPVSLIFMIVGIIAVAAILIALILNPIRLAKRVSPTVFEEEASETEAQPRSTRPWQPRTGTLPTCGRTASWFWAWTRRTLSPPHPA